MPLTRALAARVKAATYLSGRSECSSVTVSHVAVNVSDWERARRFYDEVLALFGYRVVYEEEGALAYYADAGGLDFGIGRRDPVGGAHVAFEAEDRAAVDRFHETALAAGGSDNGPPGIRAQYGPGYYAAYVLDPDGNNLEGVHHG
jgi:catechol 2,3-dioxygenase-like lactoylglutathione lyase family enzyme